MNGDEKLIYMANQIARNVAAMGHDRAVEATEAHLRQFWEPRMRARIVALAATDGSLLGPIAAAAVARLAAPANAG